MRNAIVLMVSLLAPACAVDPANNDDEEVISDSGDGAADSPVSARPVFFLSDQGARFHLSSRVTKKTVDGAPNTFARQIMLTTTKRASTPESMAGVLLNYCRGTSTSAWTLESSEQRSLSCSGSQYGAKCTAKFADLQIGRRHGGITNFTCRQELALVANDQWQAVPETSEHNFPFLFGGGVRMLSDQGYELELHNIVTKIGNDDTADQLELRIASQSGGTETMHGVLLNYCRGVTTGTWNDPIVHETDLSCQGDTCTGSLPAIVVRTTGTGVADGECFQEIAASVNGDWQRVPWQSPSHNFPLLLSR